MQKCVQNKYRSSGRHALTNKHFSTFPGQTHGFRPSIQPVFLGAKFLGFAERILENP